MPVLQSSSLLSGTQNDLSGVATVAILDVEKQVPGDSKDEAAARKRLQAVLDKLDPAGGKTISAEEAAPERNGRKNGLNGRNKG